MEEKMKQKSITKKIFKAMIPLLMVALLALSLAPGVLAAPEQPLLQISSVTFDPVTVSPGKEFKMMITLTNHGDYNANNVTLDVLSQSGAEDLGVFSMVGSGSHFYLEKILSGESATIEIPMVTSPNAEAKNYNLNLQINCETWGGETYNFTETVGVVINESDSMSIIAPDRVVLKKNDKGVTPVEFEIANFGSNPVRGVQLSISGDGLTFSKSYEYYGTYEKDDSDNFSTDVTTADKGEFPGKISLKYMDSFNNERTIEKNITIVSEETPVQSTDKSDENAFQKFLRVVFGIGA
ncbi:COG1361 S-layer family protein [Acetobacterium woodii]|uniref:CARDB domain-containing protein n=1 Tax=Acetobacterium woodii (strain ATCC 29683 / DSM 1030 / JCM 2381 / KCTC 1655 / WB1) TaxID=931626 RepID=H6LCS2_ACEWD|nr:hypothetical protein [Acetobacterium woodii]AFA49059.1 hypothetical protein Awo_c22860 [Acetobacterium woodii DSM 1030]